MDELYDIHIHLIYGVDDGPRTKEESVEMLKQAEKEGIRTIIATPHKRYGMFEYDLETVEKHFAELKPVAEEMGIDLLLGCEYHACSDMVEDIKNKRVHTMADTDYVLCEFSYSTKEKEMTDAVYSLVANGYKPIIAHAERYGAIQRNPDICTGLRNKGAFVQVNSDGVIGEEERQIRKAVKYLLKNDLVDVVGSDAHGISFRKSSLAKAYDYVIKKYDEGYAEKIFKKIPREIAVKAVEVERKESNE